MPASRVFTTSDPYKDASRPPRHRWISNSSRPFETTCKQFSAPSTITSKIPLGGPSTTGLGASDMSTDSPTVAASDVPARRWALVTGATGYIGGRLVPELLADGFAVRVLVRNARRVSDQSWAGRVDVVEGDAADPEAVAKAMAGIDVAYYLLHSLRDQHGFHDTEVAMAKVFVAAAEAHDVGRIVYLGGISPRVDPSSMSEHMRSRTAVGSILRSGTVPTIELGAAVVIGSGSASFEMLRYLTERLPVMVTPRWVNMRVQPIAVRDVIYYLRQAATVDSSVSGAYDIGGPDVLTYRAMMQRYARTAGLKRRTIVAVPVLTPELSSRWVGFVTPVPARIAKPLVESLRHDAVMGPVRASVIINDPPGGLTGFDQAVRQALRKVREAHVETRWSDATVPGVPSDPLPSDPHWAGGDVYRDERETLVRSGPDQLWRVIESIGGENGWYSFPLAWEVRGVLDTLVDGVGLRRGRRDPWTVHVGEAIDFWRVEERVENACLRLRAEMRLPGLAWLELSMSAEAGELCRYRQRAIFVPRGLGGHIYWWLVAPFHGIVFGSMVRNIRFAAESGRVAYEMALPERIGGPLVSAANER